MVEIESAAADLVADPIRQPTSTTVLADRARRVRRRYRRTWAAAAAVVISAGGISAGLVATGGSPRSQQVATGPSASTIAPGAGITPAGYARVDYGNASIAVPAGWPVLYSGESICPPPQSAVLLGETNGCGLAGSSEPAEFARLTALTSAPVASTPVTTNGHAGLLWDSKNFASAFGERVYSYPDLHVTLTVLGPQADTIAQTIGWSAQYLVLHPTGPVTVPAGWKETTFGGITFKTPPAWPAVTIDPHSGSNPAQCEAPEFPSPVVDEGQSLGGFAVSCPFILPKATAGVNGIWVRPYVDTGSSPPAGSTVLEKSGALQVLLLAPVDRPNVQPVLQLQLSILGNNHRVDGVAMDIGIGDPATAQEILSSISTTPHLVPTNRIGPAVTVPSTTNTTATTTTTTVQTMQIKGTTATYVGPIHRTVSYPDGAITLTAPGPADTAVVPWQNAVSSCFGTVGICDTGYPTRVVLARATTTSGAPSMNDTLVYVVVQTMSCSADGAGGGPVSSTTPGATTTTPPMVSCATWNISDADTGGGLESLTSPGLPDPSS